MMMLAETTDSLATALPPIITAVLGALGGGAWERRRNGRRNNPGTNANDYRYTGKPGSDWKAGRGETCKKHGERISAAEATVQALGGSQAAIHQSQTETRQEIGELRRETSANFTALHARLDAALLRGAKE